MAESLRALLRDVRSCQLCTRDLPHGARPILQLDRGARILIASQAPGRRAHESGVPFRDASGERLRQWMRVAPDVFYDASRIAILPMGFCYPGTGPSGDLPPRPECSDTWRRRLLAQLPQLELTLVIGQYAQAYHLPRGRGGDSRIRCARGARAGPPSCRCRIPRRGTIPGCGATRGSNGRCSRRYASGCAGFSVRLGGVRRLVVRMLLRGEDEPLALS